MNIKKALKHKGKLVNKISTLIPRVRANNSVIEGIDREFDPKDCLNDALATVDELIATKVAIYRANVPVIDKIIRMAELKSFLANIKGIDTSAGTQASHNYGYRGSVDNGSSVVIKTAIISRQEKEALVEKLEAEIEALQDEMDVHNAKKKILE